jgi:acyl-CoA thioester hydrolase
MDPDPELTALLAGFPVVIRWPVQWGDMDAFQHVNNTVFFRWFESARIAYTMRIGLKGMMETERVGPILASMSCDYCRPLVYPDTVLIGSRVTRIGRTSLVMEHALVSVDLRAIAAEGRSTIVVFDYAANKPTPVPDAIRKKIDELEGGLRPPEAATGTKEGAP